MANSITLNSSSYDGRYMRLVCKQISNGGALNTSTIKWTLETIGGNSNYYTTGATTVIINGATVYSKERTAWNTESFPASKGSVSGEIVVSHNSDGSKEINVSFSTAIYTSTVSTYSDKWTLDSIPRYADITSFSVSAVDETMLKFSWGASAPCDFVWFSTDNGASWGQLSDHCLVGGLSSGTTYKCKIRVKRQDSQLITESGTIEQTTYDYPHCISTPDFTIGDPVTLKFYNPLGRELTFYIIANGKTIKNNWTISGESYKGLGAESTKDQLYETIPESQEGEYKVQVVYGDSIRTYANKNKFKINPEECTPTGFVFYWRDLINIIGDEKTLIKDLSQIGVSISTDATANKSAYMSHYVISIDTLTAILTYQALTPEQNMGAVTVAGNKRLLVRAYDSRGLYSEEYEDITIHNFEMPVINAEIKRLNNFEAETTLKVSGTYSALTFDGIDHNSLAEAVKYRYRETGGEWGEWTPLTTTLTSGKFTCNDVVLSLDNSKSFKFQISATDLITLNSTVATATVDVGQAIFFVSTNKKECYINNKRVLHDTIIVEEAETDLNNYLTTGLYFFGNDYTPLNIPAGVNGWLEVIGSKNDRVKQVWYRAGTVDSNDFMTYTRTYIDGTWGVWSRLATVSQDLINDRTHIADYIVEQGTSGIWIYEKWNSGIIKLYGYEERANIAITSTSGNVFRKADNLFEIPSNLGVSSIHCILPQADGLLECVWAGQCYAKSKTQISIDAICGRSITTGVNFHIKVIGKWK